MLLLFDGPRGVSVFHSGSFGCELFDVSGDQLVLRQRYVQFAVYGLVAGRVRDSIVVFTKLGTAEVFSLDLEHQQTLSDVGLVRSLRGNLAVTMSGEIFRLDE